MIKKYFFTLSHVTYALCIASLVFVGCKSTAPVPVSESLAEKHTHEGSVFKELKAKVWAQPYTVLPQYKVDIRRIHSAEFKKNSERTVDVSQDFIASDQPKIVHPNGLCLAGEWRINPDNTGNTYTGYFANGSQGLVLARASTAGTNIGTDEHSRLGKLSGDRFISYGFTGKIFPTIDLEDHNAYRPANFITQTDLGGQLNDDFSDVEFLNAPHLSAFRRGILGAGVEILAKTGRTFDAVDKPSTIRQVYEIAELAKPSTEKTNTPQYLKLVASTAHRGKLPQGDFRKALQAYIQREKQISFDIFVANEGYTKTTTKLKQMTVVTDAWKKLGTVTFTDAAASQACDFNLHFHHPAWRNDRNEPSTQVRHKSH